MAERTTPAPEIVVLELSDALIADTEVITHWPATSKQPESVSVKVGRCLLVVGTPDQHRALLGAYASELTKTPEMGRTL